MLAERSVGRYRHLEREANLDFFSEVGEERMEGRYMTSQVGYLCLVGEGRPKHEYLSR